MTFLKSLNSGLRNNLFTCFFVLLIIQVVSPCVNADLVLLRPAEQDRFTSVTDRLILNLDLSFNDMSYLFINGQEIAVSGQSSLRYPLEVSGFGIRQIHVQAISNSGKLEQLVRSVYICRTFPDIRDHWAKTEIEQLATLGFISDYFGGLNFFPENPVSRIDLAKAMVLIKGLNPEKYTKNVAQDVLPGYWGQLFVNAAVKNSLLGLDEKDNFAPQSLVTRTEIINALVHSFPMPNYAGKDGFLPDLPEKFWAKDAVYTAMLNKLLPGKWDLKKGFLPNYIISRAEFAAILARLPQVKEKMKQVSQGDVVFDFAFYETDESKRSPTGPTQTLFDVSKNKLIANNRDKLTITFNSKLFKQAKLVKKVEIDLTAIGKPAHTPMLDDGQWGDNYANDDLFSVEVVPDPATESGHKALPVTITDLNGNSFSEMVTLEILENFGRKATVIQQQIVVPEKRIVQTNTVPAPLIKPIVVRPSTVVNMKPSPAVVKPSVAGPDDVYIVAPGDTMMVVAYKMTGNPYTWKDIARYNNIKIIEASQNSKVAFNANIEIGQKIIIPRALLKKK